MDRIQHPSAAQLAIEGVVVGIVLSVIFIIVHVALMKYDEEFAMSHTGMALGVFLAGMGGHLAFEFAGLNDKFVVDRLKPQ